MIYSWSIDTVRFTQVNNTLKSESYCQIIGHISGTVKYDMVMLLQINKITFEKSEKLRKKIR